MKTTLNEQIQRLASSQMGIDLSGDFSVLLDSVHQHDEYPDRFTCEALHDGKRVQLEWKRKSITPELEKVCGGALDRYEAEAEGLYYDHKLMRYYVAVPPNYKLSDVNRVLGTQFSEEQLLLKTERFDGYWEFDHPCFYGRILTQVLLPKAS